MTSSRKHPSSQRAYGRILTLFALVFGPTMAIASCSSDVASPSLEEEQLAQFSCGGRGIGGTTATGGISRGGTAGFAGCPPSDTCTSWTCTLGTCRGTENGAVGDTCTAADMARGHCGIIFSDSATRTSVLGCCVNGCLDSRGNCIPYSMEDDAQCGRLGGTCKECGECKSCNSSGSCVAVAGACTGGQCLNGGCCTGCISGPDCVENAVDNCGSNGVACENCIDTNSCTADACVNGACQHTAMAGGCDDGNECTVNDSCSGTTCNGSAKNCDDQNDCTMDGCSPGSGCTHTPIAHSCDDGNVCTINDACSNGSCTGAMLNCDDGNQCTVDTCSPASGCVHTSKAEDTVCSDGSDCSTGDRCHDDDSNPNTPRVCEPLSGPNCEDGNPCTSDTADCSNNTCPHAAVNDGAACSTGSLCTVGETCEGGTCQGGSAIGCNDQNDCTTDTCVPATGCKYTPVAAGSTTCNDGNPCTTGDSCDSGDCVGEPVDCVAVDDCHDVGTCDADSGSCTDPRKPNGSPCGRTGTCQSGRCEGDGVVGTGGTGSGTSGGGPGGNETGGTGTAGDGAAAGDVSGGSGGTDPGPLFKRDPGGCACRLGAATPEHPSYAALAALTAVAFLSRRRRRAA